jgi:hypothetical protein
MICDVLFCWRAQPGCMGATVKYYAVVHCALYEKSTFTSTV